jgi:hypothetical protein
MEALAFKSGLGHSDIRGLGTAGQWFAVGAALSFRGSHMCRHSITADHPTVVGLPAFCSAVVVALFSAEDALHPLE